MERLPYYHIQQVLLADVLSRCAPARVLEFGCGFGRHFSYLKDIPGLRLVGCDQSASMLAAIPAGVLTGPAAARIVRNDPLMMLPFRDKAFDVVYTVNVLLHIPPYDVPGVLGELVRVTRSRLIHLEPAHGLALDQAAHDGCFSHDLAALYGALGHGDVGRLAYCRLQEAVVVDLDDRYPRPAWSPALLSVLRQLETALGREAIEETVGGGIGNAGLASTRPPEGWSEVAALRSELEAIQTSHTWRLGRRLALSPLGRLLKPLADRLASRPGPA